MCIRDRGIDGYDYEDKITARVRLGIDAKVNKNTSVKARITTGSIELGDSAKAVEPNWDLVYVEHKFIYVATKIKVANLLSAIFILIILGV